MLNCPVRADIAWYVTKRSIAGRNSDKRSMAKRTRNLRSDQITLLSALPGESRLKEMRLVRQSLGSNEPPLLIVIKREFEFGFSRLVQHDQRALVLARRLPCFNQLANTGHRRFPSVVRGMPEYTAYAAIDVISQPFLTRQQLARAALARGPEFRSARAPRATQ